MPLTVPPDQTVTQAEAQAGTGTARRAWSPLRVWDAIRAALGGVSVSNSPTTGQVLTATGTSAASWQAPSGGLPAGITSPSTGTLAAAAGTITASAPSFDATQTWNAAGVTFTGWRVNITDTASAAASRLLDVQVGGTTQMAVRKDARLILSGPSSSAAWIESTAQFRTAAFAIGFDIAGGGGMAVFDAAGAFARWGVGVQGQQMPAASYIGWTAGAGAAGTPDAMMFRDGAANIIAQRNGTAAQEKRVYGTFTDASNHRRVAIGMSTAGAGYLRPEGAGTGATGNTLQISTGAQTVASLPSASTAGAGARLFVTDANATTFAAVVAGGGANGVPVYSDGTNWRIG